MFGPGGHVTGPGGHVTGPGGHVPGPGVCGPTMGNSGPWGGAQDPRPGNCIPGAQGGFNPSDCVPGRGGQGPDWHPQGTGRGEHMTRGRDWGHRPGGYGNPETGGGNFGPGGGNFGPGGGNFGPGGGNFGPGGGNCGPDGVNFGPGGGNFGPGGGNFGPGGGNFGPGGGNFGPGGGNFGPGNFGSGRGDFGTSRGNWGPGQGNWGSNQGNWGPNQGDIGPKQGNCGPMDINWFLPQNVIGFGRGDGISGRGEYGPGRGDCMPKRGSCATGRGGFGTDRGSLLENRKPCPGKDTRQLVKVNCVQREGHCVKTKESKPSKDEGENNGKEQHQLQKQEELSKLSLAKRDPMKAEPPATGLSKVESPKAVFQKVEPPKTELPKAKILKKQKVKAETLSTKNPKSKVSTSALLKAELPKGVNMKEGPQVKTQLSSVSPVHQQGFFQPYKPTGPCMPPPKQGEKGVNVKEGLQVKSQLESVSLVHQKGSFQPYRPPVPHKPVPSRTVPGSSMPPQKQGKGPFVKKKLHLSNGDKKLGPHSGRGGHGEKQNQLQDRGEVKNMIQQKQGSIKMEPSKLGSSKKGPIKAEPPNVGLSKVEPQKAEFLKERQNTELLKSNILKKDKVKVETLRTKTQKAEVPVSDYLKVKVQKAKASETERAKAVPTKAGLPKAGAQQTETLNAELSKDNPVAKHQKGETPKPESPQAKPAKEDHVKEHQQAFLWPCRTPQSFTVPHKEPAPPEQFPVDSMPPPMSPVASKSQPRFSVVSYAPLLPLQMLQQPPPMPRKFSVPPPFLSVPQLRPHGPHLHISGLPVFRPILHIPTMESNESRTLQQRYFLPPSMPMHEFSSPPAHSQGFSVQHPMPPMSPVVIHGQLANPHALPKPPVYPQESPVSYQVSCNPQIPQQEGRLRPSSPVVMVQSPFILRNAFPSSGPSASVSGPYSSEETSFVVPIRNRGAPSPAEAVPIQDVQYPCAPLSATQRTPYTLQKDSVLANFSFKSQDVFCSSSVEKLDCLRTTHDVNMAQEQCSQPCGGDELTDAFPSSGPSASVSGPYSSEGTPFVDPIHNDGAPSPAESVTLQKDSVLANFSFKSQDVFCSSNVEKLDGLQTTDDVNMAQEHCSQTCGGDELTDDFPSSGPSASVSGPYSSEGTSFVVPIRNRSTSSPAEAVPINDVLNPCAPLSATQRTPYTLQKDSVWANFSFKSQDVLCTPKVEKLDDLETTHDVNLAQEHCSLPCGGDDDIDSFMEKIKKEMQILWPDADNCLNSRSRSRSPSLSSPRRKHSRLTPSKHSSCLTRSRSPSPCFRALSRHSRSRSRHSRSRSRHSRSRSRRSRSRSRRSRSRSRRSRSRSRRSRSRSRRSRSWSRRSRSRSRRSRSRSRRSRSRSRRSRSWSRRSRSRSWRSRSRSLRSRSRSWRSRSRSLRSRSRSLRSRSRTLRSRSRSLPSRRRTLRSRSRSLRSRSRSLRSRSRSLRSRSRSLRSRGRSLRSRSRSLRLRRQLLQSRSRSSKRILCSRSRSSVLHHSPVKTSQELILSAKSSIPSLKDIQHLPFSMDSGHSSTERTDWSCYLSSSKNDSPLKRANKDSINSPKDWIHSLLVKDKASAKVSQNTGLPCLKKRHQSMSKSTSKKHRSLERANQKSSQDSSQCVFTTTPVLSSLSDTQPPLEKTRLHPPLSSQDRKKSTHKSSNQPLPLMSWPSSTDESIMKSQWRNRCNQLS
ncbi:uncharacterized protein LOC144799055 [Lissotriton helveticus]